MAEETVINVAAPWEKLQEKMDDTNSFGETRMYLPFIFRVHEPEPQMISFGPYHWKNASLAAMKKHKWSYLKRFLARNKNVSLEKYFKEMTDCEYETRCAYFEEVELERDEFVEMMLLDGCFLVELFMIWMDDERNHDDDRAGGAGDVDDDDDDDDNGYDETEDPLQRKRLAIVNVLLDMLMPENQLPFSLLETLFDMNTATTGNFLDLAVKPLMGLLTYVLTPGHEQPDISVKDITKPAHLLHLFYMLVTNENVGKLHMEDTTMSVGGDQGNSLENPEFKCCLPTEFMCQTIQKLPAPSSLSSSCFKGQDCETTSIQVANDSQATVRKKANIFEKIFIGTRKDPRVDGRIPPATKLQDAGVKFKRKEDPKNILDITFEGDVLNIPQLRIGDNAILRNLIVYEQYNPATEGKISDLAFFLDCLIDTAEDVEILQQEEIIYYIPGKNDNIASLCNDLCSGIFVNPEESYLAKTVNEINMFCNTKHHIWRAKLNRDYFGSPWALLSLLAAIFLLILTVVQAVFAPVSYFRPRS